MRAKFPAIGYYKVKFGPKLEFIMDVVRAEDFRLIDQHKNETIDMQRITLHTNPPETSRFGVFGKLQASANRGTNQLTVLFQSVKKFDALCDRLSQQGARMPFFLNVARP